MGKGTEKQRRAAASILARDWGHDHDLQVPAAYADLAYAEWGRGIADMICAGAPVDGVVEYLAILEGQLGFPESPLARRRELAARLFAGVGARSS